MPGASHASSGAGSPETTAGPGSGAAGVGERPAREGAQDLALDGGVVVEERQERPARQHEEAQGRRRGDGRRPRRAVDQRDLAEEVPRAEHAAPPSLAADLGLALGDDEELLAEPALAAEDP